MKILYVTTIGETMGFFPEHVKMLLDAGHTVDIACNNLESKVPKYVVEMRLKVYFIPFSRSPLSKNNLLAFYRLKKLIKLQKYDLVHTHTPNASVCVRLACRNIRKNGTKVVYTAHGFHFYKGAPLINWLLYFPVEWLCSFWTDILITINREDYLLAQKRMHAKNVVYVPGVGVDLSKFETSTVDGIAKREEMGVPRGMFWGLNIGGLIRKDQETLIKAVASFHNIYLTIVGEGDLKEHDESIINEFDTGGRVALIGQRTDIYGLCKSSDIFISPSYQEGLPIALIEAMACGKPCVVSKFRENTSLIDEEGGEFFESYDEKALVKALSNVLSRDMNAMGQHNIEKIKHYDITPIVEELKKVYTIDGWKNTLITRKIIRNELNVNIEDVLLIYVAELNRNKNQSSLLDMMHFLKKEKPNVKLMLVGEGDFQSNLEKKCQKLGICSSVIFTGYRDDIPALYCASDYAVPSSVREGLPVNVIEAMASGVPVIAYENRGHNSIINNNVDGILIKQGDYIAMANAIKALIDNPEESKRMSRACRERAKSFEISNVLKIMKDIYS